MTEETLTHINEGRTAQATLQWMEPLFARREKQIVETLKSCFRQGKQTELVLSCHVSQLCAIEDLREMLNALSRRGQSASQQIEQEDDGDPDGG